MIWHDYMADAYEQALESEDPSTQNGAIFVAAGNRFTVGGYNRLPDGVSSEVWKDKTEKYKRVIHAEVDAIGKAAGYGTGTGGGTLVCPWACCYNCAGVIIAAGVRTLVVHKQRLAITHEPWLAEVRGALEHLAMNFVEIVELDVVINCKPIRAAGRLWTP